MFLINLLLLNKSDARKWATSWQNCRRVLLIPFKKVLSMRERIRESKLMLGESIFLRHNSLKLKRDYFRCKLKGLRHLFNEELNIVIPKYECISFVS